MMGKSDISGRHDRVSQIKNDLTRLFKDRRNFLERVLVRSRCHLRWQLYEKRRDRIRGLFAEPDELKKAA